MIGMNQTLLDAYHAHVVADVDLTTAQTAEWAAWRAQWLADMQIDWYWMMPDLLTLMGVY